MNITQLVLLETGTYDAMMMRPYEAIDSHRGLHVLQEATRFGQNITPEALSGVVGGILRPSATPVAPVSIANGWGQKRYRFFMTVVERDLTGNNETEQYLTGYTDYDGVSIHTGNVDPHLRFYVNQSIRMRTLTTQTPYGRVDQTSMHDASHVFNNRFHRGTEDIARRSLNLQRPQDIFTTLQTSEFRRYSETSLDPRTTFAQENVKLSNRNNAIAPKYLSKILQAGSKAFGAADPEATDNSVAIWAGAEGLVRESVYAHDPALFNIYRNTSYHEGDSFTFAELEALCPHLQQVTKLMVNHQMTREVNNAPVLPAYQAGSYDGWNGQDVYTVWASILSNAVPVLMMECMLHKTGFVLHNHTLNGEMDMMFSYVSPFGKNLDGPQLANHFKFRLINEVMRDLLAGNQASFSLNCHFDIIGESRMEISINGSVPVPFATPTFSDALFAPVLTMGQERVRSLADQVEFFTEHLTKSPTDAGIYQKPQPIAMPQYMPPTHNPQHTGAYRASSESL